MKHIRITTTLILLFMASLTMAQTQNRQEARERLKAQKIAFITTKMGLTEKENQQFWAIYNEKEEETQALKKEKKNIRKELKTQLQQEDGGNEAEMEKLIEQNFKVEQDLVQVEEKYYHRFKSVIPLSKVILYYRAEEMFKEELRQRIKERRAGRERR